MTVSVFTTIALRSAIAADPDKRTPHRGPVPTALSVSQVVNLAFSFITNVTATFMIGMWAWYVLSAHLPHLHERSESGV